MSPTLVTVVAEFTRPANTNGYSELDAVANSTSAPTPLAFKESPEIDRQVDRGGLIIGARLMTDNISTESRFRLHLFSSEPTGINDNAAFNLLWTTRASYMGYVDFDYVAPESQTSTMAYAQTRCRIKFLKPAGQTVYFWGMLETLDEFTPTSGQNFRVALDCENIE